MSLPNIWVESVALEEKHFFPKKKKCAAPGCERSAHKNEQGLHQLPALSINWIYLFNWLI